MEKKVNLREVGDKFYDYALVEHSQDLLEILKDTSTSRHYAVHVNFVTLCESCSLVTDLLRTNSYQVLPVLDSTLLRAHRHVHTQQTSDRADDDVPVVTLKSHLHVRLVGLPACPELQRICVPRTCDMGQLVCVSGTVVRTGLPRLLQTRSMYACNKCHFQFSVPVDYENCYQPEKPSRCANPTFCRAGSGFSHVSNARHTASGVEVRDYQELRIQEQAQKLDVGKVPRSLCVTLEDDLVDSCSAGDHVMVTGTVMQRWRSATNGSIPDVEMALRANRVLVCNEHRLNALLTEQRRIQFDRFWRRHQHSPISGRNEILQHFCSQIYGLYVVKLAVALTLIGGVRRTDGAIAVRGEPHLLLVGDPGTGKSQFLKYAAKLCPRAVLTTGIGSTSAGLTCSAVKEGGEWQLEAGALVLADGGVCCIDEFNTVREQDKTSIHEAMEQQSVSVAKAGMVCKLNTRCSILAAANPKGSLLGSDDVLASLGMASPLLSRFDLILVLKDVGSRAWDKLVSGYILAGLDPLAAGSEDPDYCSPSDPQDWSTETLQAYIVYVRSISPVVDDNARRVLRRYYQLLRQCDGVGAGRCTVRLLESLLRLCQAHARLRRSSTAGLMDAVVAVVLSEASLGSLGGGLLAAQGVGSVLHTAFPDSPQQEYRAQCELILGHLDLNQLLEGEISRLDDEQRLWRQSSELQSGEYRGRVSCELMVDELATPVPSEARGPSWSTSPFIDSELTAAGTPSGDSTPPSSIPGDRRRNVSGDVTETTRSRRISHQTAKETRSTARPACSSGSVGSARSGGRRSSAADASDDAGEVLAATKPNLSRFRFNKHKRSAVELLDVIESSVHGRSERCDDAVGRDGHVSRGGDVRRDGHVSRGGDVGRDGHVSRGDDMRRDGHVRRGNDGRSDSDGRSGSDDLRHVGDVKRGDDVRRGDDVSRGDDVRRSDDVRRVVDVRRGNHVRRTGVCVPNSVETTPAAATTSCSGSATSFSVDLMDMLEDMQAEDDDCDFFVSSLQCPAEGFRVSGNPPCEPESPLQRTAVGGGLKRAVENTRTHRTEPPLKNSRTNATEPPLKNSRTNATEPLPKNSRTLSATTRRRLAAFSAPGESSDAS